MHDDLKRFLVLLRSVPFSRNSGKYVYFVVDGGGGGKCFDFDNLGMACTQLQIGYPVVTLKVRDPKP